MIISLRLGRDSYDVMLDEEAELTEIIEERFSDRGVVIVTNPTLRSLYAERFEKWKAGFNPLVIEIPDGEEYKNLDTWRGILDEMLHAGFDRRCVVVTFGGGVVGDVGGFAASSFLRGVDYIQIPTTLLAMVDSSVGGKTGVNHARGKNLIGSFYQPKLVYADISFLDTLPEREFLSGYGEVFKYGFIGGRDTFDFICSNHDSIVKKRDRGVLQEAVERSIRIKADIVSMDEREKGVRALLNFGHTFGHSLEKYFKYKGILHGEGVLWGIKCAIELGKAAGSIPERDIEAYSDMAERLVLPALPEKPDPGELFKGMFRDKKVVNGEIRFILPEEPGKAGIYGHIQEEDVKGIMERVFG